MRRVLAGFQQQHVVRTARGQPVGQHGTGGPAADDNIVVDHDRTSAWKVFDTIFQPSANFTKVR